MSNVDKNVLGFDYGHKTIGVARVNTVVKLPEPLEDLVANEDKALDKLISEHKPDVLVVGLPRSLDGSDSKQTEASRNFAKSLERYGLEVVLQDEALSTVEAEKRRHRYAEDTSLDAIAATVILEDYLTEVES